LKKICLISDTHGKLESWVFKHFEDSDEIWHCGDLGSISVIDSIKKKFKFRAVYGNIDNAQISKSLKKNLVFKVEDIKVLITHIAGPVKKYNTESLKIISNEKPQLLVCGHSHILKVVYDEKYKMLYMNPGSCGSFGIHKVKTLLKFKIEGNNIKDLKVIEKER
tara:strand:+ start:334 stop:825 length:492 start_codon:yes stop_codon:yes gene_type:complete